MILSQYLDQAQRVLVNSPAHDVLEVYTLFINCIEVRLSQYLDQALRVLVNSPAHDVLEVCTLFINCIEVRLSEYLDQALRVLVNSPAHDVLEVCTLFINCIEVRLSQYLDQALRVLVNSPAHDVLEVCTLFINCIEVRLSEYLDQALRVLVNSPAHDVLEVCTLFINCIEVRLSEYLDQAQRVLVNSPAHDVLEVCTLFINCIEVRLSEYLDQALRVLVNSPTHDVLEVCTLFINCIEVRLSEYLDQALRVLVNSPAHDVLEVCTLFINCIEVRLSQYLDQALRVLVNSPAHDVLEVYTLFINCIEVRLSQYLDQAQRVLVNSPAHDVPEVCTLFINCIEVRLSQYLDQALRVLVNSPAHDVLEVCTLFINCIEDALYRKASSQANPSLGLLNSATLEFRESAAWLRHHAPDEGVTVQYLQAIAGARFGMVVTAQFLHESNRPHDREIEREIKNLFEEAKSFCNEDSNHQAHLFLIRQLCKCYGTNTMDMLSQHAQLKWVKPRELRTATTQVPDRFVVCGSAYREIREALAQFVMTDQFGGVTAAVRDCKKPQNQREAALLLALYREVTLSHCAQGDQEEVPQQMKQELQIYIQSSPAVHCKQLANCLVTNQLGPFLSAAPGQTIIHQTLSALVVHTFTVLSCAPNHHLLRPLKNFLIAPAQLQTSFLPTMPEDYRMEAREALAAKDNVQWYECQNGHPYTIGECGQPNQPGKCQDCGMPIGGAAHRLVGGGRQVTAMRDTTTAGHVLGDATNRGARAVPERYLNAISISIMRALLHAAMIGATLNNQNAVHQMIHPTPATQPADFLMHHLVTDLNHLAAACGKSQDDCLFIIHMVLHRITTSRDQNGTFGTTWPNKQCRRDWEMQFNQAFIMPAMENLDQKLANASETLRKDQRFSANPLMRLLHQPVAPITKPEDLNQLHSLPAIWQHRPRINVESLQQYLTQNMQQSSRGNQQERPLALLQAFLEQEAILQLLHHLPDIIRLQQMLIDKYHRRIDAAEATSMSIQEFLEKLPQDHQYVNQIQPLIGIFIDTWNQVREHIPNYVNNGGLAVPREHCMQIMTESSSLAMLLPTRREAGVCSTALVDFLIRAHNGFIETYHRLQPGLPKATVINPCDASIGHLVAYHHDRDLLPMILSHCDYAMEAGSNGTRLTYNLLGLQRQIKERFVQGRPKLVQKIEHLVFRQDSRDATVFQALRTKIPQESLSPAIKHQILSDLRSFPDLCDCLAALDIAIGFLVNTEVEASMRIREYLHRMLKLPLDRGLKHSPKAQQYCRLNHILSLWQALAVERARRLLDNRQDPFEGVKQDYRDPINPEQQHELGQSLRHINVEHLVAELYEYIMLDLKKTSNQEQDRSGWPISAVLSAYIDGKDGQPVHEMEEQLSADLVLRHAVDVWRHAVDYMQQHHARAGSAHH
ncbi:E3 ubiquitin-protein ligase rnf213-alpha-like [Amphiura filiformis]|uniref:E3 ubiquitin-protein ligase rnf213-alpha-like n=1 Tax=Amphiura filiformis TaxID=82378 RepID=UPI003B20ED45